MNGGNGRDDDADFRRELDDVRPADRGRLRPEPSPDLQARKPGAEPTRFETAHAGEHLSGWAPGTDRRLRKQLRNGEIEIDRTLDLHGLDSGAAKQVLRRELFAALAAGERSVLVIHGRGLRSESGPALKDALPGWLAEPPHGGSVLAFESAGPGRGGPGATAVLLRRKRQALRER